MASSKDRTGSMGKLSRETREKVDEELKEREASLLKETEVVLETLRPRISDKESFDKLIAVVNDSTQRNESIGELRQRIVNLGKGAVTVAKEVSAIIKAV